MPGQGSWGSPAHLQPYSEHDECQRDEADGLRDNMLRMSAMLQRQAQDDLRMAGSCNSQNERDPSHGLDDPSAGADVRHRLSSVMHVDLCDVCMLQSSTCSTKSAMHLRAEQCACRYYQTCSSPQDQIIELRWSLQCPCLVQVAINSQIGQGTVNLRASDYIEMQKQLDQHQHEVSQHCVRLPRCSCSASCDQLALTCLQSQQRMYDCGCNIVLCDSTVMFSAAYRMSETGCATKCANLKTLCVGSKSRMRRGERINPRLANTDQGRTYTLMWCAPAQALADRGHANFC